MSLYLHTVLGIAYSLLCYHGYKNYGLVLTVVYDLEQFDYNVSMWLRT